MEGEYEKAKIQEILSPTSSSESITQIDKKNPSFVGINQNPLAFHSEIPILRALGTGNIASLHPD